MLGHIYQIMGVFLSILDVNSTINVNVVAKKTDVDGGQGTSVSQLTSLNNLAYAHQDKSSLSTNTFTVGTVYNFLFMWK